MGATHSDCKAVIVVLEGGVVQSAHGPPDMTVVVVDWDEIAEGGQACTVATSPLVDVGPEVRAELERAGIGPWR